MSSRTHDFRLAIKAREPRGDRKGKARQAHQPDPWMGEAQRLASAMQNLLSFLNMIRRAYLAPKPAFPGAGGSSRSFDPSKGLAGFQSLRWLSDAERDTVDLQVGTGIRGCMDTIRALEVAEKGRQARRAKEAGRLLRRNQLGDASAEVLTAHRASIVWYLNDRLASLGKHQKELQESRAKRELDRSAQGGLGGVGPKGSSVTGHVGLDAWNATQARQDVDASGVPLKFKPARPTGHANGDGDGDDEKPIESLLTASQIQQFESESSAVLRETQETLSSLRTAESSLLEISSLQSDLVHHLTQQAELTDKLWEDAIVTTGKVEEGNRQLKIARERNRESRVWLLIFLLGASFALLFVDYIA